MSSIQKDTVAILILDIKPLAEQTFVRVREFRDDQEFIGTIGPLKENSKP